jgi:phosphoribosylformylglycinamidine synthase
VGAAPLGLTNCLNFGNPEKPTVAWQLDRSTQGLAEACEALGVPVVGGNVSLYNETEDGPIYPTPVVGMVGELPVPGELPAAALREGDAIAFAGPIAPDLRGSQLAKLRGELGASLPSLPIESVAAAIDAVSEAVAAGRIEVAHDISDGGLACALAEMAIAGGVGADVDLDDLVEARGCSGETALFGEGPGGFLLAGPRAELEALADGDVDLFVVGTAGGDRISIAAAETEADIPLADAERAWRSLGERLEPQPA